MKKWMMRMLAVLLLAACLTQMTGAVTIPTPETSLTDTEPSDQSTVDGARVTFSDSDIRVYGEDGTDLRNKTLDVEKGDTVYIYVDYATLYSKLVEKYPDFASYSRKISCTIRYSDSGMADVDWMEDRNFKNNTLCFKVSGKGNGSTEIDLTIRFYLTQDGAETLIHTASYDLLKVQANEEVVPEPEPEPQPITLTVPDVEISVADGTIVTDQVVDVAVAEEARLSVALDSARWKAGTMVVGTKKLAGYFYQDSNGNYFYLTGSDASWSVSGSGISLTKTGGTAVAKGEAVGAASVSVSVPCSYLMSSGGSLQNMGVVGYASARVKIAVTEPEQIYKNPFEGIDPDQVENPFSDVSRDAWYYDYIMYLVAAGFYEGMELSEGDVYSVETLAAKTPAWFLHRLGQSTAQVRTLSNTKRTFAPDRKENRANTVQVLYNGHKSMGGMVGSYTNNRFSDVSSSRSYYQAVLWGTANKVINGYGGGRFGPADGITREQFCAILVRYANTYGFVLPTGGKAKTFKDDGSISSYARDAVVACQKAGIINGMTDGTFRPQDGITRAQVAAMIYRFINNCVGGTTV